MLREFSAVACLALKQLRHLAVRVKPISFALRACFLGHYHMARMSQSASPCGLASWMRPHMVPDAHLLKLLFPTRYTSRSIYQSSMCDSQSASSCGFASLMGLSTIYYIYDVPASLPFHKKFKNPYTVDEYSHKSNERKILTVLRRNSIIIVNCSAEYI